MKSCQYFLKKEIMLNQRRHEKSSDHLLIVQQSYFEKIPKFLWGGIIH